MKLSTTSNLYCIILFYLYYRNEFDRYTFQIYPKLNEIKEIIKFKECIYSLQEYEKMFVYVMMVKNQIINLRVKQEEEKKKKKKNQLILNISDCLYYILLIIMIIIEKRLENTALNILH